MKVYWDFLEKSNTFNWGYKFYPWFPYNKQFVVKAVLEKTNTIVYFNYLFFLEFRRANFFLREYGRHIRLFRLFFVGNTAFSRLRNPNFHYSKVYVENFGYFYFPFGYVEIWNLGQLSNPYVAQIPRKNPKERPRRRFLDRTRGIRYEMIEIYEHERFVNLYDSLSQHVNVYQKANLLVLFALDKPAVMNELKILEVPSIGFVDAASSGLFVTYPIHVGIRSYDAMHFYFWVLWEQMRIGNLQKIYNEIKVFEKFDFTAQGTLYPYYYYERFLDYNYRSIAIARLV